MIVDNIEGCDVFLTENDGHEQIEFTAKAAIDGDGTGSSHGDPDYQNRTTLRRNGKYLNADEDLFIALSPDIIKRAVGIVLGCHVRILNQINGKECSAVVGDVGPHRKLGEVSIACAKALGINPSPTTGGEERHRIKYTIYPGVPAVVNGVEYSLMALMSS